MATASEDLQKAIRATLLADAAVAAIVGTRVADGLTADATFPLVTFGPTDWRPEDMDCVVGREETVQLDCWTRSGASLRPAKALADKVARALHKVSLSLDTHAAADLTVEAVRAFMDPDQLTGHGIVVCTALIEER